MSQRLAAALGVLASAVLWIAWSALPTPPQKVTAEDSPRFISGGKGKEPFDVTRHVIPISEILGGGPPRDGIPALHNPQFMTAVQAGRLLRRRDRVLGVSLNGEAKAYPVAILNWHELVNDQVGGRAILVSWCPLCGSGVVYDPVINGRRYDFGVSGLLYKRNLLLFDRQTDSLWSQLLSKAVTGPLAGARLKLLPAENTTWTAWRKKHPETRVLSFVTGHKRDYKQDPYADYPFLRQPALLVAIGEATRIYPYSELKKLRAPLREELGGHTVTIVYDLKADSARVESDTPGSFIDFVASLDDLKAFFPEAEIFKAAR